MNTDNQVVVIGGGVIGVMSAWYLRQAGHQVTLLERDQLGASCSHGNCGYVSPSHVLPLTQPGAVAGAVRALLQPNGPLKIRFRLSPSLWNWLYQFSRRCNQQAMLEAATARHALLQSSVELYRELIHNEKLDCEWQERGILFVFADEAEFESYRATDDLLSREFGVSARPLDADALCEVEPALKPGLGGAWWYECDCHLKPDRLIQEMRRKLDEQGVSVIEGFGVQKFVRDGSTVRAVSDGNRAIEGDRFVVAAGAVTPFLNREIGCQIPIQPGKGYSLTMPTPKGAPKIPMIFEHHRVAITPMDSAYRIGSTMEFAGYDTRMNRRRLDLLKQGAAHYLRVPFADPIEEQWYGWRPMTWDGKPIIDRSPQFKNMWVAAGHNMLGISMATGTGKLVAEMVGETRPHVDPSPYRIARFRGQ